MFSNWNAVDASHLPPARLSILKDDIALSLFGWELTNVDKCDIAKRTQNVQQASKKCARSVQTASDTYTASVRQVYNKRIQSVQTVSIKCTENVQ